MEGYKSLKEGQRVQFELTQGDKGLMAGNIQAENAPSEAQQEASGNPPEPTE
jgi:CspA family cold shock protein